VTFAEQDALKEDEVAGPGHGFVDVFDTSGHLVRRFASRGKLNAPWGLAMAPSTFRKFAGDVLVGNFGDGRISAFDPTSGKGSSAQCQGNRNPGQPESGNPTDRNLIPH
jgi:uncharacterized protein (TIGR03118 family)